MGLGALQQRPSSGLPVGEAIEAGDKWRLMISGVFFCTKSISLPKLNALKGSIYLCS